MNAPRRAAAAAVLIATVLTAGAAAAQSFDTTPQYSAYPASSQTVPKVNLPKMQTSGISMPGASVQQSGTLPSAAGAAPTIPSSGTTADPKRRTDAGAIRKSADRKVDPKTVDPTVKTGTAPAASTDQKYPAGMVIEGRASIYDGQNLIVEGVPLRLDGAEAPATAQQCMTRKSLVWNCGKRASDRLTEIASGKKVRCVVTEPLGAGAAAICSTTGISDLGAAMIREGWAVANGHDHGRYSAQQMSAKAGGLGMWVGPFEAPWTYRSRHGQ
jgi:endonuclease YncB( thermonuclease family)